MSLCFWPIGQIAAVRRMDTYISQREQALRTIAEFERVKGQLASQYAGRYVAFFEGQVVDSDWDRSALSQRFYAQHGNVPVCIAKVSEDRETIQITTTNMYTSETDGQVNAA